MPSFQLFSVRQCDPYPSAQGIAPRSDRTVCKPLSLAPLPTDIGGLIERWFALHVQRLGGLNYLLTVTRLATLLSHGLAPCASPETLQRKTSQATMSNTFLSCHVWINRLGSNKPFVQKKSQLLYCIMFRYTHLYKSYDPGILFHPHITQHLPALLSWTFPIYVLLCEAYYSLPSSAKLSPGRQTLKSSFSSSKALQLSAI